ncbi:hypothetical protein Goshw_018899 [Gossypium schwendimanii]|uniref:Reverse transcriptase zinc-binding domain-containing protein n=1 Tax=Gossypium schwendimanii TaxID=34291 RepID=A0A7J9L4S3_GOSSC|nr:hypothetical protein [Gossypium schwendimanii]
MCPRFLVSAETLEHIFRNCPSILDIWESLHITWPNELSDVSFQDWLLYVFTVSTGAVIREMVYLLKYDAVNEKLPGCLIGVERWRPPNLTCVKVNFDAVFHAPAKTSCAGIVIRDHLGMVMGSQSVVILSWRSARSYRLIMICRPLGLTSEISMQWLCSFAGVDSCMFPELRIRWPICWQLRVSGEGFMLTRREGDLIRGWGMEVEGAQGFVGFTGLGKSLIVSVGVQVLVR